MDLSMIFTVPGKQGLYKLVSQGRSSALMEGVSDRKRLPVFNLNRISSLAEIAIYTETGEISLSDVFRAIHKRENGGACLDFNATDDAVRAYFGEVLPDFDRDRVYNSNIRKVLQWYNILQSAGLVDQELSEREKAQREEVAAHNRE